MVRTPGAQTLADEVFEQLRAAVLDGRYRPGQRLIPAELSAQYGVNVGVLREALTRLAGQQLAVAEPNRGYRVVSISHRQIDDLVEMRSINECAAMRLAIARGDTDWESRVIAAHHRLTGGPAAHDAREHSALHRDFHLTVLSACGNERLLELCDELYLAAELYRRWANQELGRKAPRHTRATQSEHDQILEAVLQRDVERAVALHDQHLRRTGELALEYARQRESAAGPAST